MSTRELIDAIQSGDSVAIQGAFESAISSRIAERLDTMRQDVAKSMFKESVAAVTEEVVAEEVEDLEEATEGKPAKVGDNHIHVQKVEGNKYKVHAVGKNFADGIKAGEHLNDTELDDFQEMGGKIRHVK